MPESTISPPLDDALAARLASFIRQGRVILFTGAGFSLDARAKSGSQIPTPRELAEALWGVAFPRAEFEGASLGNVYEAARAQASKATQSKMRELLTVDPRSLSEAYRLWFSFPGIVSIRSMSTISMRPSAGSTTCRGRCTRCRPSRRLRRRPSTTSSRSCI